MITGLMTGVAFFDSAVFSDGVVFFDGGTLFDGGALFAGTAFFEGADATARLSAPFPRIKVDVEAWLEVDGAATEGAVEMEVISEAATEGAEETEREGRASTVIESPLSTLSISISPSSRSMVYKDSKPEFSGSARARHSSTPDDYRTLV